MATGVTWVGVAATQRAVRIMIACRAKTLVFRRCRVQDYANPPECGDRQGIMGELIIRFVARAGLDRMIAEHTSGVIHILPPRVSE